MSRVYVKTERVVDASPEDVYAVLADYKNRPQMLTDNFMNYTVERGGYGNGTVVSYVLRAANRQRPYKISVDESVKGEVITERDANSSLVTTWSVAPLANGRKSKVRVASEWEGAQGVGGFFEKTFAPLGLRRIYNKMLSSIRSVSPNGKAAMGRGIAGSPLTNARGLVFLLLAVVGFAIGISVLRRGRQK
ncbi:MAG TPA: SRPBCC family protein [Dictyobacter sp.]|jgi:hypothetical protein|nr:SRPBCC family protein [Dictyobacter sp.]